MPKLVLFWMGTLIMFATGFCAAFASSAACFASSSVGAEATAAGFDCTEASGLSCGNAGRTGNKIEKNENTNTRFNISDLSKLVAVSQRENMSLNARTTH